MVNYSRRACLIILDGLGINSNEEANAFFQAHPPFLNTLLETYPTTTLTTFGEAVGLPEGQMGNSEVGHLNIGAGRVVEQWLVRISRELNKALSSDSPPLPLSSLLLKSSTRRIHLIGLWSYGGVHSSLNHLRSLVTLLEKMACEIVLHLISDGRDVSPRQFLHDALLAVQMTESSSYISVGSVCGRYYAMDRDTRWDRVEKAYRAIVEGIGVPCRNLQEGIREMGQGEVTDEFILPHVCGDYKGIQDGDGVILWNFRSDRMRELAHALSNDYFPHFNRGSEAPIPPSRILCFTEYDEVLPLPIWFPPQSLRPTLGEVVSQSGLTQLRAAETEKYPHVTYFLNGGDETPYPGEDRVMVPSPREVSTYDQKPEMSALKLTDKVLEVVKESLPHLIVLNYANCDMVGHTGVLEAAVHAVKAVDTCLSRLIPELVLCGYQILVTSDHGNAEQMVDYITREPHTAHTTNPVPFILITNASSPLHDSSLADGGALCDIAPTLLELMGIHQPSEMTGRSLLRSSLLKKDVSP
jgi:2,3-bisphosphoglycerate-independent phosphoglycerate mutase